ICDAVFSMDGDLAPIPEMLALCERHDAWLYVDDAHGFGVLGRGGRGSLSHWRVPASAASRLIYMATLGKAAGVAGAFLAGGNATALAVMAAIEDRGIWVPAIRPPTVPVGTARLRITLSADHRVEDVDRLCAALREIADL